MFDALYPDASEAALDAQMRRPPDAAPPTPWFKGAWSAIGKAVPRAGAEMGRAASTLLTPEAVGAVDAPSMFAAPGKTSKAQAAQDIRQQDTALRDAIKEMTPDPETTGTASMILHDVTRFVGKAAAYSAVGGMPGAVAGMGLDEGANETLKRIDEGVDPATATKLGVLHGVASAAAVAVPVAGKTVAGTLGLAAAGGPGSYVGEQVAAKKILESNGYQEEADKIDPFDPLGLGISFLGPLAFGAGAHAMRGAKAKAQAKTAAELAAPEPPGKQTPVAQAIEQTYTREQVDAARVAEVQAHRESQALHAPEDVAAGAAHERAMDRAGEQIAAGERVSVADVAPADGVRMAEEMGKMAPRLESAMARLELQGYRAEPPKVRAANFARWFEGSKVVDEGGPPLQVYHGTRSNFDEFSPSAIGELDAGKLGRGFYFSEDPRWASNYARGRGDAEGANVIPGHLALRNPVLLERSTAPVWDRLRALSKEWGIAEDPVLPDSGNKPNPAWSERFAEEAQSRGHDGVILESVPGQREFVAFGPKQVKSALGNSGRFDPNSASLTDAKPAVPVKTDNPVVDAVTEAARTIQDAMEGKPAGPAAGAEAPAKPGADAAPAADYAAREADTIAQTNPDLMVMMEGMDQPVRAADLLAEAKAMADQEIADAPLLKVAAECALRG
jgi:hypothetical protein